MHVSKRFPVTQLFFCFVFFAYLLFSFLLDLFHKILLYPNEIVEKLHCCTFQNAGRPKSFIKQNKTNKNGRRRWQNEADHNSPD